jgi:putative oxidoreductase
MNAFRFIVSAEAREFCNGRAQETMVEYGAYSDIACRIAPKCRVRGRSSERDSDPESHFLHEAIRMRDRIEIAYTLMRIAAGFLFFCHGVQKLFGALGGHRMPLSTMLGAAGLIETVCGLLIIVGLFTSVAAFIASGEMAVAFFLQHAPKGGLPIQNGGELAVLFCFLFLFVAARGAGVWSIDALLPAGLRRIRT